MDISDKKGIYGKFLVAMFLVLIVTQVLAPVASAQSNNSTDFKNSKAYSQFEGIIDRGKTVFVVIATPILTVVLALLLGKYLLELRNDSADADDLDKYKDRAQKAAFVFIAIICIDFIMYAMQWIAGM